MPTTVSSLTTSKAGCKMETVIHVKVEEAEEEEMETPAMGISQGTTLTKVRNLNGEVTDK